MKEYVENMKKYGENKKKYEEIGRYIGFRTPSLIGTRIQKNSEPEFPPPSNTACWRGTERSEA